MRFLICSFLISALPVTATLSQQQGAPSVGTRALPTISVTAIDRGKVSEKFAWSLAESPDARFDIFVAHDDTIHMYDRRTRSTIAIATAGPMTNELRWSRRGGLISFVRGEENAPRRVHPWIMPVDRGTGRATGAARQVSMRPANSFDEAPAFTPDDRFVVFASNTGDTGSVIVAPSNGGRDRVLYAASGFANGAAVSPDGKWVYFTSTTAGPDRRESLRRVPFAGGTVETLGQLPVDSYFIGVSADGTQLAWYDAGQPRGYTGAPIVIADANGKPVGEVTNAAGVVKSWSSTPGVLLARKIEKRYATRIVPVTGGPIATFGTAGRYERPIAWSPDNRFLLAQGSGDESELLVLTARGDTVHRIKVPTLGLTYVGRQGGFRPTWSPNGRYVAYPSPSADGRQPASRLVIIDVAAGTTRVLTESDAGIGGVRWRSDGQALQYVRITPASNSMREVSLSGATRVLSPDFGVERGIAVPITDSTALRVAGESLSVVRTNGTFIRMLAPVKFNKGGRMMGDYHASPDGQWVAVIDDAVTAAKHLVRVIPMNGGPARTISFDLEGAIWHPRFAGTDALLFYGGDTHIFAVPLAGGVPRNLTAADPMYDVDEMTPSPDGRVLAYQAELGPNAVTRLIDIDVTAALRGGGNRKE